MYDFGVIEVKIYLIYNNKQSESFIYATTESNFHQRICLGFCLQGGISKKKLTK